MKKLKELHIDVIEEIVFAELNDKNELMLHIYATDNLMVGDLEKAITQISKYWKKTEETSLSIRIPFAEILDIAIAHHCCKDEYDPEYKPLFDSLRLHCQAFINRIDQLKTWEKHE